MSYLSELFSLAPRAGNPNDERYWSGFSLSTAAGVKVSPETALKISTVWACVGLLSEVVAMLPKFVYQRLADGGRKRASGHPLYDLIHLAPNAQQTAFEFFEMMTGHVLLRGNAYAKIVPGPRGPADQLIPVHPDRVRVDQRDGVIRYFVTEGPGQIKTYLDDEILHLRGLSQDGVSGLSVVSYARESLGLTLGAEAYGARFFGNDSRPGGVIKHPGILKKAAAANLKESWEAAQGGENQHRVAVLEEGMEWQQTGVPPKDAQMLELREFQAEDVCRWFRVPPHMVGLTSKATSWGSGIEQMSIGFVTYTLLPWLTRWQQAISRDLILAPQSYFVEFAVEGLLRGDTLSRYNAYEIGRRIGIMNPNEIRQLENMNPRTDPGGDAYDSIDSPAPAGQTIPGALMETTPLEALPMSVDMSAPPAMMFTNGRTATPSQHYAALLFESAHRVARKEFLALSRAAKRGGDWAQAVAEFYGDHGPYVAQALAVSTPAAESYAAAQARALLDGGPAALKPDFEERAVTSLLALAQERD